MLMEKIQTKDVDNKITVTIDNEQISIPVKEIIRQSTHFIQEKSLNNVLNNPIDVKLFLTTFYDNIETNDEEENDDETPNESVLPYVDELDNNLYNNYVEHGTVKITIKNAKTNYVYLQKNISFKDGIIETQIENNLSLGEYILTAEYEGSKYYMPTNIDIYFTIDKRNVKCIFENTNITAYPNETISTKIHLIDSLNGKNVNNVTLYYSFNNNEYVTQTNSQGIATLNITIPDIDPSKCFKNFTTNDSYDEENNIGEYYWDENGNLQPIINEETNYTITLDLEEEDNIITEEKNVSEKYYAHMYPINIYTNNNSYVIENFTQYIIPKKHNTNIIVYNNFEDNSVWYIAGNVINEEKKENVKYGKITLKLDGTNYEQNVNINDDGLFQFNIDTNNFIEPTSNNKTPEIPMNYSFLESTKIVLEDVPETIERSYIKKHGLNCSAMVKSINTNKSVKEGMVNFIIMNDQDREIYNYVSELDTNGKAFFKFDVSTLGTYKIKAEYYGIFTYVNSESSIQSYTIIEED